MSRLNDEQLKLKDETLVKLPVSKLVRSQKKTFIKEHDEGFIKCNIRWE